MGTFKANISPTYKWLIIQILTNLNLIYIIFVFHSYFIHEFLCFLNTFVYFCMRINAVTTTWVCVLFACVYLHYHAFACVLTCVYMSLTWVCVLPKPSLAPRRWRRLWYYMRYICLCMLYNTNARVYSIPIYLLRINSYHYNSNI